MNSTLNRVKCGNRRVHGTDVTYHADVAEVRACYLVGPAIAAPLPEITVEQAVTTMRANLDSREVAATPVPRGRVDFADIPVYTHGFGYYAVTINGTLAFYRVERPADGKWKGYTFVKRQSSDFFEQIPMGLQFRVLAAIAADPGTAALRYGQEIEQCCRCHRALTSEWRKVGIGPECIKKVGFDVAVPSKVEVTADPCNCDARIYEVCNTHRAEDARSNRDMHRAYND